MVRRLDILRLIWGCATIGLAFASIIDEDILKTLRTYNKDQPPHTDRATTVDVGIYINGIDYISEENGEMSMTAYLRLSWTDPRLAHNNKDKMVKIPPDALDKVWRPDIFMRNIIDKTNHKFIENNHLLRIYQDGKIWYAIHTTLKLRCNMRLNKFPFDSQRCPIMIESFSNTMDILVLNFMDRPSPVQVDSSIELRQYTMTGWQLRDCSMNYTTGAYPCLEISFEFERDFGHYIMVLYIPSMMIVAISWLGFWIHHESFSARVTVSLFSQMMMMFLSLAVTMEMPLVNYITALQVWNLLCMITIFSTIIEFVLVNVVSRNNCCNRKNFEVIMLEERGGDQAGEGKSRRVPSKLDLICRLLYPVIFLLIIIIYFSLYT